MKEEIKIKNGVLKKFNVNKTIEILQIGYTLDEYETAYKNAIIVREGADNNFITDNEEVIMRFLNLYALQNERTLEEIFKDPYVTRLDSEYEERIDDLIEKRNRLNALKDKKTIKIGWLLGTLISSVDALAAINYYKTSDRVLPASIMTLVCAFLAGKFYTDAKNIHVSRIKEELEALIQEFGEELLTNAGYDYLK